MSYWSMTFDGVAERVADARQFITKMLGDRLGVETVKLVASELAGNAVQHTHTGRPGGQFTLHLAVFADRWAVRVDDDGGPNEPSLRADTEQDEAGRGLTLVAALSSKWGVYGNQYARAVWAEVMMPQEDAS